MLDLTEGNTSKEAALLEDSTFHVITQIEKKADFLYSSVEKYIRDAEKDNKPELVKLWSTMKEDEQKHLKILREHLVKEVRENKLQQAKIRGYAARQVSIYRQQVSQFFFCTRYPTPVGSVMYCLSVPGSGLFE